MVDLAIMQIKPSKDSLNQTITLTLEIENVAKRVNFSLVWHDSLKKWYTDLVDVQTGEVYFTFVPLIVCSPDKLSDLWFPFWYKGIGMFFCIPNGDTLEDPTVENLDQYALIWSDGNE